MVKVYITNDQKQIPADKSLRDLLRRAVKESLEHEKARAPKKCEVSVTLTDNDGIRKLNREYRDKDSATDVLSFPMFEGDEFPLPQTGEYEPLGDIVISCERAVTQAAELGHSTEREIAFLTVHSMLHLLGYDHERSADDDDDMCRRQREIIERISIE